MTYEEYAKLRDAKGVNDSEVARQTEMNRATLSDWKTGRSKPKQDKIDRLIAYFNLYEEKVKPLYKPTERADGIIDVETQILLRNDMLHNLLLAGGKVVGEHPEVIEAMIYTLNKMGETK